MACVSKIGSLYELVTKNVVVTTTNTVFGINPRIWLSLPCEGLLLLKIRQVVPTTGETLPVQIAVPANSTVSTVGDDTCCPVTGVAVVNPINVAVTGAAMVNVSEPRFQQPQMGQMGQYQQLQDRVIDLTVEINGSSMTYVVPESRDVAMSNNITLACSVDPIMNQLNAAKRTSSDILDSIDKHRRTLEACDSILEEINPAFKQTKDQDRKIKNLEEKVDRMGSSFDELKELLIKKLG